MRLITIIALAAIVLGSLLVALPSLRFQIFESTKNVVTEAINEAGNEVEKLTQHISTPAPLRGRLDRTPNVTLTTSGVFAATNSHRQDKDLPALQRDPTLDQAAQNKLQDMFEQQYFEHVNPQGVGPGDVVTAVGYNFLTAGENLALGNFDSDAALVQAWMDSPGHRANILGEQFQQIGLAVGQGQFEGTTTWLAVQTFATPASVCTQPNPALKTAIDADLATQAALESSLAQKAAAINEVDQQLKQLNTTIQQLRTEGQQLIEAGNAEIEEGNRLAQDGRREEAEAHWAEGERLQQQGQALLDQAQQQADEYNRLVEQLHPLQTEHNQLVEQLQSLDATLGQQIATFNQQVRVYNTCADQFTG